MLPAPFRNTPGLFQGRGICQLGQGIKRPRGALQARGYQKSRPEDPNGQNIKISSTRAFSSLDRRQTVGAAASGTFAARCPAIARPPHRARKHSRQGSNLQHAVLETAVLPLELPEYKSHPRDRTSRVYTHAPRSKLRSGGHIKTAPVLRRGCWLAHILSGKLHLGKDSKAFSWHGRLHVRPCGLSSPCAIRCEVTESNRSTKLPACYVASQTSHRSSPRNVKREQSPVPASRKGGKCQEGTRFGGCVHRFAFWLFR